MMSKVLTSLKGAALWVAGGIVLALIGAVTYLTQNGNIAGSDALVIYVSILTGVTGITTAHVTGQQVTAALNTPPPGTVPIAAPAGAAADTTPGPAI
jgi:hypothetical protein